ncbi:serine hydrolase [Microbulbifer sp. GL-2]|uniref:serine hydrolase domain-containing protein n=1 Tax=Microbulbifer sp. GL-2 TaxID=2591606 RepID=UPI001165196A|nr:serine hydrolase domain-containing protein [Microbulbifer sp. GL-2]BBM03225.1 serine hydrolase [Microbulbifer sp. GL-2]
MKNNCVTSALSNLFIATSLCISAYATGMDSNETSDQDKRAGFYSTIKTTDLCKIDEAVEKFMQDNAVPGMAIALVARPQMPIIWSKGYGVKSLDDGGKVTKNTIFWQASVSKAVMGTAIAKALESGILNLDQKVQNLLAGGYFELDNPGSQPITLQHLVTHRSGIKDFEDAYQCSFYINHGDGTHTKLLDLVAPGACPADSPIDLAGFLGAYLDRDGEFYDFENNFGAQVPGQKYEYSNIGGALAGYSLELASGFSLADYAQREIFTPLGMNNTSWKLSELNPDKIARPHYQLNGNLTPLPLYDLATWPDGGLRSSAYDMATFLATIMNDGKLASGNRGPRILEADSVAQMLTPIAGNFGIFWYTSSSYYNGEDHRIVGHNGGDPGSFSYLFFNPVEEVGVIFMGNTDHNGISESSFDMLLATLLETTSGLPTAKP